VAAWAPAAQLSLWDVSKHYLGHLEKGGNTPSLITLFELADVFNIAASEIVREVEEARKQGR
jgi:transcriptional regulator with XRE-family HTH domain